MRDKFESDILLDEMDELQEQEDQEALALRQLMLDAEDTFLARPSGRRMLWHLLEECGVFAPHVECNATIYKKEGMRLIGYKLMALTGVNKPEGLYDLNQKLKEEDRNDRAKRRT